MALFVQLKPNLVADRSTKAFADAGIERSALAKFKLKSGINVAPYGLPPFILPRPRDLSSPPLRAEKRDCILLSTISLARSSLTKIKNQTGWKHARTP